MAKVTIDNQPKQTTFGLLPVGALFTWPPGESIWVKIGSIQLEAVDLSDGLVGFFGPEQAVIRVTDVVTITP